MEDRAGSRIQEKEHLVAALGGAKSIILVKRMAWVKQSKGGRR